MNTNNNITQACRIKTGDIHYFCMKTPVKKNKLKLTKLMLVNQVRQYRLHFLNAFGLGSSFAQCAQQRNDTTASPSFESLSFASKQTPESISSTAPDLPAALELLFDLTSTTFVCRLPPGLSILDSTETALFKDSSTCKDCTD